MAVADAGGSDAEAVASGSDPTWSPDGAAIALSAGGGRLVRLLNLARGVMVSLFQAPPGQQVVPLVWTDRQTLLCAQIAAGNTRLVAVLHSGHLARVAELGTARVVQVSKVPAPRGDILIATRSPGQGSITISVLDRRTWALTPAGTMRGITYVAGWSADGRWLALAPPPDASGEGRLCLVPVSGGQLSASAFAATTCLRFDGVPAGFAWEAKGARLSYVRVGGSGWGPELREVAILPAPPAARMPKANARTPRGIDRHTTWCRSLHGVLCLVESSSPEAGATQGPLARRLSLQSMSTR
jgi:hypothetical protein